MEPAGIWRFAESYHPHVEPAHRLTLGEGATPLVSVPVLADAIGVQEVLLKRDDLSPGGSHKARSLAYRVSVARQRGEKALCISSSGNAAVAASLYAALAGIRLFAFMSPATADSKLRWLRRDNTSVVVTPRPRNLARYAGRLFGIPNLTPSLDDLSIEGFKSIACEIVRDVGLVDAVFTFVTSGSSLVGMGRMFAALSSDHDLGQPVVDPPLEEVLAGNALPTAGIRPSLHAVQSGATPVVAGPTDRRWQRRMEAGTYTASQLAGLLGVDDTPRAEEARRWLRSSGGIGWVETDDDILAARDLLRGCGVDTSPEGAACLSAAKRARAMQALTPQSRIVVMLTGHGSQWPADDGAPDTVAIEGYAELRRYLKQYLPEAD